MSDTNPLISLLDTWHEQMPPRTQRGQGTYFGALVVLENLIENFQLGPEYHFTDAGQGGRIATISSERVRKILFGLDDRISVNEYAGRTSPGPTKELRKLLVDLAKANLDVLDPDERRMMLRRCQAYMAARLWELQSGRPIKFILDPADTVDDNFSRLFAEQKESGRDRAMAQHLVGAKLELRFPKSQFPGVVINRDSVDAADASAQKPGDFQLGDTVYHVTVSFSKAHLKKCADNVARGLRPVLLVLKSQVSDATVAVRLDKLRGVRVRAIEDFVTDNIEEMSVGSYPAVRTKVREVISAYNDRVDVAEVGKPYLRIDPSTL